MPRIKKEKNEEIINKNESVEIPADFKVIDDRQATWDKFLANYEKENPVKFFKKKANGEFDQIPDSFK